MSAMTIRQKLEVIQKMLGETQTQIAARLGVSFATVNSWWLEKSTPRAKMTTIIDDLYLTITGKKTISTYILDEKIQTLKQKAKQYPNILSFILKNRDVYDELILKLTYHSNSIEGSTLSEADTQAILFDNVALPNKTLTEQIEAKNHQTAIHYLFDHIITKKKISEELILKLHSILMNGILPDAGFYRRHAVRITGLNLATSNYLKIPDLIPALIKKVIQKNTDPIGHAALVHAKFEHIHPFADGNGRIGRLLMNAMLLSNNFAPAIIRSDKKRLYYTYLYKAQRDGEISQIEDFVCDAIFDGFLILGRKELK